MIVCLSCYISHNIPELKARSTTNRSLTVYFNPGRKQVERSQKERFKGPPVDPVAPGIFESLSASVPGVARVGKDINF